jgi:uncharacterized protein
MYLACLFSSYQKYYLFDAYYNELFQISDKEYENIIDSNLNANLLFRNPLYPKQFNIKFPMPKEQLYWMAKNKQTQLILGVTNNCNLRCSYCCYQDTRYCDNNFTFSQMTLDVAKRAIDEYFSCSNLKERRSISFYGGEPLLNFKLIKDCVEYIKSKSGTIGVSYFLTTNGLLLENEEILTFLLENNFYITISLDGPAQIHDRYRIDILNRPTFYRIVSLLNNIFETFPEKKVLFSFNSVLTPPINTDLVYDFFESNKLNGLTISNCTIGNYFKNYLKKSSQNNVENKYNILNFKQLADIALSEFLPIFFMRKRYDEIPMKGGGFCIPAVRKIYVSIDGNYFPCERVDETDNSLTIGNVFDGLDIEKVYNLIIEAEKFSINNCKDCFAAGFCSICYASFKDIDIKETCNKIRSNFIASLQNYLDLKNSSRGDEFLAAIRKVKMF